MSDDNFPVAYAKEMDRCREVLKHYDELGNNGKFGAAMIRNMLQRAQNAVAETDVVAMLKIYQEMEGTK